MRNYKQENKAELYRIKGEKAHTINIKTPKSPEQERRSLIIKSIACGIALLIAAISFSTFAKQCTRVDSGLQSIDANTDSEALMYASGIVFNYELEGTSNEMRATKMELRNEYSNALSYIYKLLDPVNSYEGYVNIAYINAHPDEEIEVSPELYSVLSSAKDLTERGLADVFGGLLYHEWQSITVLNDSAAADPLNDADERERMEEIVSASADRSNFSLELMGGDTVRFTVSEEYLAMCERLEADAPILDLGYLREAYMLQYTARTLEKAGYKKGFITTVGGMTICLSEASGGYVVTYSPNGDVVADAFKVPVSGGLMWCTCRAYSYGDDDIEHYTVEADGAERLRHPNYSLETGEVNDALVVTTVIADEGDFAEVCARCKSIATVRTAEEAAAQLKELGAGMHAAFVTKAEPTVIIADGGFDTIAPADRMTLKKQ